MTQKEAINSMSNGVNNLDGVLDYLTKCKKLVLENLEDRRIGLVSRVNGLVIEATGLKLPLGNICLVEQDDGAMINAEVVGFSKDLTFLMPLGDLQGLRPGAEVYSEEAPPSSPDPLIAVESQIPSDRGIRHLPLGDGLLGRVVDAAGNPLDSKGPLREIKRRGIKGESINPLNRAPIKDQLDVGVRAINSILAVGKGQRIGLFAGSGVGKSVLLGMMSKYTQADRVVVGLIGERGREVAEFIEQNLGEEGLEKSVVVAAPADSSPLLRMQGASYATAIAEDFRAKGLDVLLIMDSLTRYAMAQREIALAMGEPPATKGYPPSVFAKLPALVERAGNGQNGIGSITAFYTVLAEGDDQQDPVADSARAILDGHIVLSRELADSGHYPAIDIEKSISRVMQNILNEQELARARLLRSMFSKVMQNKDLISIGAYAPGNDRTLDVAVENFEKIEGFLRQEISERCSKEQSSEMLALLNLESSTTQPAQRTVKRSPSLQRQTKK